MRNHFYNTAPFTILDNLMQLPPFGTDVYVVSDSQYKEYRQKQAADEIAVLQKRLEAYERAAAGLQETIDEIRKEHNLLPEASEE